MCAAFWKVLQEEQNNADYTFFFACFLFKTHLQRKYDGHQRSFAPPRIEFNEVLRETFTFISPNFDDKLSKWKPAKIKIF